MACPLARINEVHVFPCRGIYVGCCEGGTFGFVLSFGRAKQGSRAPQVLHSRQRMQPDTFTF